jgi:hypothetical protein
MQILSGHVSPESAYVVDDYPYGFRLRCKIRYWLEYDAKRGFRFVSQTTNPKLAGERWNKPKASTYASYGGAMFLDDSNHVQWSCLTEYSNAAESVKWRNTYGAGLPESGRAMLDRWMAAKLAYEARRATRDAARAEA